MTRDQAKRIALKICKPFYADNGFTRWIFPVIRNVNPADNLIESLVSVQPMSAPASTTFYLDFVYDSRWERFKRFIRGLFNWRHWLRTIRRRRLCNICGYERCGHLEAGYGRHRI
ncbi:MAG: hypothetical protein ACOYB3_01320 [Azonexus sp.]